MDIQAMIDELTAEIDKRISARDALRKILSPGAKQKPNSNRSIAQRRRWAEQKRRQRDAVKKGKK